MTVLGASCGLPLPLVFGTSVLWFKQQSVGLALLGFISQITLLYALKFFWAPFCDYGKRRYWILLSQSAICLLLLIIAVASTSSQFALMIALLAFLGFFSTIQDISVDAWRIECPEEESQGTLISLYLLGYRLGLLLSSSFALIIVDFFSWQYMYAGMSLCMAILLISTISLKKGNTIKREKISFITAFLDIWHHLRSSHSVSIVLIIFGVISLFRLCDVLLSVISRPLFVELGYSLTQIGSASAVSVYTALLGSFLGAFLLVRYPLSVCLFLGVFLAAVSNALYLFLIVAENQLAFLTLVTSLDNLCSGIAGTVLIAWMSRLVNKDYTATHYALFSSLSVVVGKLLAGWSGAYVEQFSYSSLFLLTIITGIPVLVLILHLYKKKVFN